ncbi:ABC transporter ATP-binding protein [Rhodoligotrophos defluvii]|uniref:ABC transporter ATP-binding protein n=1 Tax=Rhodoligotrophos defluvii TaxID=2561934 RepID=UPI001485A393|nr:ABC transporter ATP-binding protein [Rhodoligotrophos defluvii]
MMEPSPTGPLLAIRDLKVSFTRRNGPSLEAVRGVDFTLHPGEVLAVVGESGSGKSLSMLAAIGLTPPTATVSGSVRFRGVELVGVPRSYLRSIRGAQIAMIFQDSLSALNPVLTVGDQIAEALQLHHPDMTRREAWKKAEELLALVAVPQPDRRVGQYPHEFSGGMRQRAMIAMAVANNPTVLIADEPTTALDVTVQAQVMDVLKRLREQLGLALILITHDMGVVAGMADRVAVMYAGRVVEDAAVADLFRDPRHPYTRGLLASVPKIEDDGQNELYSIPGAPPLLGSRAPGCAFSERCAYAAPVCGTEQPALRLVGSQRVACHFADRLPRATKAELAPEGTA